LKLPVKIFDTPEKLAESFAKEFSDRLKVDSRKKDKINVALSGGSTPKLFFQILADKYKDKINWRKINLFWADERCEPPENPESNYGMTKDFLLDYIPIPAKNIHRVRGEDEPEKEAIRYSREISDNVNFKNEFPQFDIILLGIGEDGHTASIFPNQIQLMESPKICGVSVHPASGQKRITLTGRVINNASYIAFLVTGKGKAKVVSQNLNSSVESNNYPVAKIAPVDGILEWYLDKDAAGYL